MDVGRCVVRRCGGSRFGTGIGSSGSEVRGAEPFPSGSEVRGSEPENPVRCPALLKQEHRKVDR